MKNDSFKISAAYAIDEGERARLTAARRLASQFTAQPGEFDPSALEPLGEEGLTEFLSNVGGQIQPLGSHELYPTTNVTPRPPGAKKEFGWAHQRRNEPHWLARAALYGCGTTFTVATVGSLIINLLTW